VKGGALGVLAREDESGKEKGGGGVRRRLLTAWRKEGRGFWGGHPCTGRRTEGGGPGAAVGGRPWPMVNGHVRVARADGTVSKISNGLKMFNFFQILIDPNLTFPTPIIWNKIWFSRSLKYEQLSP
jgi:hypothetical protein